MKGIHLSLLNLPKDYPLHYTKVLKWIQHNQKLAFTYKKQEWKDVSGAKANRASCEGYVRHMRHYLKHGDWIDNFYGEDQELKIYWRST